MPGVNTSPARPGWEPSRVKAGSVHDQPRVQPYIYDIAVAWDIFTCLKLMNGVLCCGRHPDWVSALGSEHRQATYHWGKLQAVLYSAFKLACIVPS